MLKYSKCMNFSLSGLDLKLLFMVTGAYYESGLYLSTPTQALSATFPWSYTSARLPKDVFPCCFHPIFSRKLFYSYDILI